MSSVDEPNPDSEQSRDIESPFLAITFTATLTDVSERRFPKKTCKN